MSASVFRARELLPHLAGAALVFGGAIWLGLARGAGWLVVAGVVGAAAHASVALRRPLARARALSRPFPEAWRRVLERRVRFYRRLDAAGRRRFERNLTLVLADYRFHAVPGVDLTDELRVLSAAGAAMLVHGRDDWELPGRREIVLYPDHFDDSHRVARGGPIAGMVQHQGAIVLSVRALLDGWSRDDGYNVSLHEFAHVLDLDDGAADGVPAALSPRSIAPWLGVMARERKRVERRRSILRAYAATHDAELFAVAVEVFFEQPHEMERRHPELYGALMDVFGLDPGAGGPPESS